MASLLPGTLLGGRYSVTSEINRGGTAVVYEAWDQQAGQAVALKVMNVHDGRLAVSSRAVKREIEFAAAMRHPNIVQLLNVFAEDDRLVLVWQRIDGPDLLDYLNESSGRLSEETAARLFAQLINALMFIHAHGLCHRDIKPENCVLQRSTGRLVLIDFGLSRHQNSAVTLGVGTPDYLAPELLGGNGDIRVLKERHTGSYDATRSDTWACGVMLYLLVCGVYPFEDPRRPQDVLATLKNIAAGRYRPIPAHVSPACADLLRRLLVKDPEGRITLPQIMQHPWLAPAVAAMEAGSLGSTMDQADAAGLDQAAMEMDGATDQASPRGEATIAAFPGRPAANSAGHPATFSFHMLDVKAPPPTPRIIHLAAMAPGAPKPVQGLPPSSDATPIAAPITPILSGSPGSAVVREPAEAAAAGPGTNDQATAVSSQQAAKRQRSSAGLFCSFFGFGISRCIMP